MIQSRKMFVLTSLVFVLLLSSPQVSAQNQADRTNFELNTVLMESTFKIEGRNALGQPALGTAFIMGRPYVNPPVDQPNQAGFVLITAAHVLEEMQGDTATLHLRRKVDADTWVRVPQAVQIRANGQPLWKKHPAADIAVMYVSLPKDDSRPLLSTEVLADDKVLADFEIHPGDDLECLGYPFGQEANDAGFPVLRSGKIASYPLLPTSKTKTFLFDFRVFRGNSGGPVYMVQSNRWYKSGGVKLGQTIHIVIGLVSEERLVAEQISGLYSQELRQFPLGLAVVVHASLIKEAIGSLPPPDTLPH
jgi:S1-C subfamily serine protease